MIIPSWKFSSNTVGLLVYQGKTSNSSIDLKQLDIPSGHYFIRFSDGDKLVGTEKLI